VEFTARQYSHIYKSRFEKQNTIIEKEKGVDVVEDLNTSENF